MLSPHGQPSGAGLFNALNGGPPVRYVGLTGHLKGEPSGPE
jgi:hypothetical protein